MAQQTIQLDREKLSCSICLDLLEDPVTIPCGHSYCRSCITDHWKEQHEEKAHSCPQCRQSFTPRPVLMKNTMLAELVEDLKKAGPQAASLGPSYAGPEDVACDFCTGRKVKAVKSCLVCMVSYCEQHLQPHYDSPAFKKHKLIEATLKLRENICSRHDKLIEIFCRTDQQSICYLCSMDDHKGHDTVSAAAERSQKQTELEVSRLNIQQRVQDREKDLKMIQQRVQSFNQSADQAVTDSEKTFTELIRLLEKRSCEVKQQIRSQQEAQVSRAEELEEKLQQEITELRRKDSELEKLSHTDDHLHFLKLYSSLSSLNPSSSSTIDLAPLSSFETVTAALSEVKGRLQELLSQEWTKISTAVMKVDVLTPAEPKTRADFLKYSRQITLDPNTVNGHLVLSNSNRTATLQSTKKAYPPHKDRFIQWRQVLSEEGLTGRQYWEVKWSGRVYVAVAYKDIPRAGNSSECGFGLNDNSWSLECRKDGFTFRHNNTDTSISGPQSSTVGVYLDHGAGSLSYYSVSETMTLLHRVQTTFTKPLYTGFWLSYIPGGSAELCDLQSTRHEEVIDL